MNRIVGIALVAFAGCRVEHSLDFCEMNPHDQECKKLGQLCLRNGDCGLGQCDKNTSKCVECVDTTPCYEQVPICDQRVCRACETSTECGTGCRSDGTCADEEEVAYVTAIGAPGGCTIEQPCGTIDDALATGRPFVHIAGDTTIGRFTIDNRTIAIIGEPGAKIIDVDNLVTINGSDSNVTLEGLHIGDPAMHVSIAVNSLAGSLTLRNSIVEGASTGVRNSDRSLTVSTTEIHGCGTGISSKGDLIISRSRITKNTEGGILAPSPTRFEVTNTFVDGNGPSFGGVDVNTSTATSSRFDFNTIVGNSAVAGTAGGVNCSGGLVANDNVIAGNRSGSASDPAAQVASGCNFAGSTISMNTTSLRLDAAYHLMAGSPLIDAAASTIAVDFDGDARPVGAAADIGADEMR